MRVVEGGMQYRVIIDSNMLSSDILEAFLAFDAANRAVLIDYAWMEAYKKDAVHSFQERFSVLSRHAEQVLILKGTGKVGAPTVERRE